MYSIYKIILTQKIKTESEMGFNLPEGASWCFGSALNEDTMLPRSGRME